MAENPLSSFFNNATDAAEGAANAIGDRIAGLRIVGVVLWIIFIITLLVILFILNSLSSMGVNTGIWQALVIISLIIVIYLGLASWFGWWPW